MRRAFNYILRLCFMFTQNTVLFDPSMENDVPKALKEEVAMAITSASHLETKMTLNFPLFVHPYGGTDVLNPSKESVTQLEHIPLTPSCQKPVPCPI